MEKSSSDEMKKSHKELKHLGFVRAATINTIMWLSSMYEYAKLNSGPLRSTVGSVEGAVSMVVSPAYDKFKDVPDHVLAFLDDKGSFYSGANPSVELWLHPNPQVDVANAKFNQHAPPLAKKVAYLVHHAIEKTTQLTKDVVRKAQTGGALAAARYAAKESTELVLDQSIKVWLKLDQLPSFHMVAETTVPIAANWSEKYNKLIADMRGKGYPLFTYIPMVPSDDIAKAFKQSQDANVSDNREPSASEPSASEVSAQ